MSFWPYAEFVRFDNTKVNTLFIFTLKKKVSPNTVLLQLTAAVHKKKNHCICAETRNKFRQV